MGSCRFYPESFKDEHNIDYNINNLYINYIIPYFETHPLLQDFISGVKITLNELPTRKDPSLCIKHQTIDDSSREVADGYVFDLIYRDKESRNKTTNDILSTFHKIHGVIDNKSVFQIQNISSSNTISIVFTETILTPTSVRVSGVVSDEKSRGRESTSRPLFQATYVVWVDKTSNYNL